MMKPSAVITRQKALENTQRKIRENFITHVAMICHEANRMHCHCLGDPSQLPWGEAPEWQKKSAIEGVEFHMAGDRRVEDSHENWMKCKVKDGWKYGAEKDADKKTHPCIKPYSELPLEQQMKDHLFRGIVHSVAPLLPQFLTLGLEEEIEKQQKGKA